MNSRLESRRRYQVEHPLPEIDDQDATHNDAVFQRRSIKDQLPDYRPVRSLLDQGDEALERCPTPPPARKLFSAIFELDESPWCGLMGMIHANRIGDQEFDRLSTSDEEGLSDFEVEQDFDSSIER